MDLKGIKTRFAYDILREEWDDFERRHRQAIKQRTTRRSGRLEDQRSYSTSTSGHQSKAVLKHPIHERFLDMKRSYEGDKKTRYGTKKDVMWRVKGIAIHNRLIFGKLNAMSFRLLYEMTEQVREFVRKEFPNKKGARIN